MSTKAGEVHEAPLRQQRAYSAFGINTKPLKPKDIRQHMRLSNQHCAQADTAQVVAQCRNLDRKRNKVPGGAVAGNIVAGIGGHARRAAYGPLHIGPGEARTPCGQGIDMRCPDRRVAITTQVVAAQLVTHDEKDIADFAHGGFPVQGLNYCGNRAFWRHSQCWRTRSMP